MKKKYIVFDIDRTIVDSFIPELLSLQEAIKNVTGKELTDEEKQKVSVLPTKVFFKTYGFTEEETKSIYKEWIITFNKYPVLCFNGIKDLIRKLYLNDYKICIITSRTMEEYNELEDELRDISSFFSIIVTSDLVNNHKPNRDSMDYLCNKLNCNTNEVIYIGDSNIDQEFAKNSNCSFIGACWDNKELINEKIIAYNPIDILERISNIENEQL